jgi:hypothetical protein
METQANHETEAVTEFDFGAAEAELAAPDNFGASDIVTAIAIAKAMRPEMRRGQPTYEQLLDGDSQGWGC